MAAGRPAKPPWRAIIWRGPENLLIELYALHPTLRDGQGGTRYGAIQDYITGLVVQDLEKRRREIRRKLPETGS